jgi:cell wall assembly regulator SMI1
MNVRDSWDVIHSWLDKNQPSLKAKFQAPARKKDLAHLEKVTGFVLPDDFKASYLIHNGSDSMSGPIIGLPLMSLAEIERGWKTWADLANDEDLLAALNDDFSSSPTGFVQPVYAHRGWLPFAGDGQNNVALDYAPGPKGTIGQVINCGRDDEIRYRIAPNFTDFMAFVATQFQKGHVQVRPEDPDWLCIKGQSEQRDFLTSLNSLLKPKRKR